MSKLFGNGYNEWRRNNKNVFWRHYTRHNFYEFYTSKGYKTLIDFVSLYEPNSVLDYGCGYNEISDLLPEHIQCVNYDPYIPKYSEHPNAKSDEQFDLIFCCGVLHCVESDYLDNVIKDIHTLTKKHGHVVVNVFKGGFIGRTFDTYVDKISACNLFEIEDQHLDTITTTVIKASSYPNNVRRTEDTQTTLFMLLKAK